MILGYHHCHHHNQHRPCHHNYHFNQPHDHHPHFQLRDQNLDWVKSTIYPPSPEHHEGRLVQRGCTETEPGPGVYFTINSKSAQLHLASSIARCGKGCQVFRVEFHISSSFERSPSRGVRPAIINFIHFLAKHEADDDLPRPPSHQPGPHLLLDLFPESLTQYDCKLWF